MQKTLIEAFVLVVLVVYLFLGSLRATLIPTLAVPVSLIGTFIVLNAIGYSANTVSLLAIVLAIGIVVDDAIVVVENVERIMEEHPELSPAEATKRAMAEITAPIIAITLVLLSVFVPVAFIPGISGELFRQFAITVAVSMFLSAINALDAVAGACAACCCGRITARGAGRSASSCAASTGCATPMAPPWPASSDSRSSASSWSRLPVPARSALLRGNPDRLSAGRRPGRVLCRHSAAGRRLGRTNARRGRRRPSRC